MTGPVTALGIRDGDPAVLRALIARRGSAVLAYCERACAPTQVPDAAADAFARFRSLVVASPRPADLDPEAALLSSTRHAAADRAPRGQAPPAGAGLGRLLGGRPTADQITLVPQLLIARADGTLDAEGEEQLNRLLDASAAARAAEERFRAAEHAYRSAPPRDIPAEIVDHIVAAMSAVPAPSPQPAAGGPDEFMALTGASGAATAAAHAAGAEPPPPAPPSPPPPPPTEPPPTEPPPAEPPPASEPPAAEPSPASEPPASEPPAPEPTPSAPGEAAAVGAPAEEPSGTPSDAPSDEWDVPQDQIAAARLRPREEPDMDDDEFDEDDYDDDTVEAARLQTASGAVDDAFDDEPAPPRPAPVPAARRAATAPPPQRAAAATASHARRGGGDSPRLPARSALAPAAAVIAVAGVSILAYSGVFGGNESQPPVDTGVAPRSTQVEVPEGEAAAVIDDLRQAASEARQQRLADKRGSAPPEPERAEEEPAETPAAEPQDDAQSETPAPAEPEEPAADEETPQDQGAGTGGAAQAEPPPDEQAPAEETP